MKKLAGHFIPSLGTLIILGLFLFAQAMGAFPLRGVKTQSTSLPALINYQGRLNDAGGDPVPDGSYTMTFRLYSQASGGTPLWTEVRDVTVSGGLFNVMLGEVTALPSPFPSDPVYLGVKVGADEEMTPRETLGSVPFALVANVPDGAITTAKLADEAVTTAKLNVDNGLAINGGVSLSADEGGAFPFQLQIRGRSDPNKILTLGFHTTDDYGIIQSHIAGSGSYNTPLVLNPSGGNVGIGVSNPSRKLEVAGATAKVQVYSDADKGFIDAVAVGSESSKYLVINPTGGNVGIGGEPSAGAKLHVFGNIQASGTKSAVVNTDHYGQRKLYAFEQAGNRFADEGKARLVNGSARVNVDPIFLETIERDFLIHVTPYGDASLYVAEIGVDYFVVKAREGSGDVEFAWMLTAARKGYGDVRLEEVE